MLLEGLEDVPDAPPADPDDGDEPADFPAARLPERDISPDATPSRANFEDISYAEEAGETIEEQRTLDSGPVPGPKTAPRFDVPGFLERDEDVPGPPEHREPPTSESGLERALLDGLADVHEPGVADDERGPAALGDDDSPDIALPFETHRFADHDQAPPAPLADREPPTPESGLERALLDGLADMPEPGTPFGGNGAPGLAPDSRPGASSLYDGFEPAGGSIETPPAGTRRPLPEPDLERALVDGLTDVPESSAYSAGNDEFEAGAHGRPLEPSDFDRAADFAQPALADWDSPQEPDLEQALLDGLSRAPEAGEFAEDVERSPFDPDADFDHDSLERTLDEAPASALEDPPESTTADPEVQPGARATLGDALTPDDGESLALAFATDPDSESALRDGLSDHADPQVWPGGLRTAIEVIATGNSSRLIFVDLDETPYPAGAIHELAAVCDVGTVVVALGSNGTARFSREILLAGVSDYLVKPITATAVREAAARATNSASSGASVGWSVGFCGTGGSGATTVAAATALLAAERGRYVSVLDLNRTFPALSFLLDVEPAAGLVELLSTAARASLHPEMVDGMRAERSDRIAVYGYPWSTMPPPLAPVWAVCELLVELQRRSHLVLVDGIDDPATRLALLPLVDARVLVVEPTPDGATQAARVLERFGPMLDEEWPFLLVQNHTRAFKPEAGARTLHGAGVAAPADVVIPFEPALPTLADRGWPGGRLPKSLKKSFDALANRILAGEKAAAAPVLA